MLRGAPVRWFAALFIALFTTYLAGCATGPVNAPIIAPPTIDPTTPPPARLTVLQASDVTLDAISLVGTPYRHGGNTPAGGFDCSGLIAYVYKKSAGLSAPRTVQALSEWGQPIDASHLQAGDVVLFSPNGAATHAGIYVGEGRFVHAPSTGGEVRLDSLRSHYWSRQPVSFRRP